MGLYELAIIQIKFEST